MMMKLFLHPYGIPLAKLFLVPIMLWIICQNGLNKQDILSLKLTPLLIFPAIIVNQFALSLFALRMQLMLGIFGIKISRFQSLRIHLQSVFYFFVLPMTVGLEAARYAKIKSIAGENAPTVTLGSALLADRLIGALVALLLAIGLLPFVNFKILPQWDMRALLAVVIVGGGLILVLSLHGGIRNYAREAFRLILSGRRGLWIGMIVSILTHLFFAFGIYLAAMGAHIQVTFLQTILVISTAMLFVILPVSFAGIGPVEAAGLGVLLGLGVPMEHAVIFVLISYAAKLIAAIEGGCWELYEGGEHISRHILKVRKERSKNAV